MNKKDNTTLKWLGTFIAFWGVIQAILFVVCAYEAKWVGAITSLANCVGALCFYKATRTELYKKPRTVDGKILKIDGGFKIMSGLKISRDEKTGDLRWGPSNAER